jgi:hypothetical protein
LFKKDRKAQDGQRIEPVYVREGNTVDIAPDVLSEFASWFHEQLADDPEFHVTLQQVLRAAETKSKTCLDELLNLPKNNMSLREWVSTNLEAIPIEFRDVRRVGGDHDRGFTSVLNRETRKRRRGED